MPDRGLRSSGMRDLGPEEMARFRRVERVFLDTVTARGYREVRTPTIEPLHLYTASGALSPQALDRIYSFLDWDGWSGERVVLRPDATVAVARRVVEHGLVDGARRFCYVQPAFRFEAGDGDREIWQCGVELFGVPPAQADAELLLLARDLLQALGLGDLSVDLAHAGLARAVLASAGLSPAERIAAYDRMLDGDAAVTDEIAARRPDSSAALRLLAEVDGATTGYVANMRAALLPLVPEASAALDELESATRTLDAAGIPFRVLPGTARNFEYYTGLTFRMLAGGVDLVRGGRYDGLTEALGGPPAAASGFAADLHRLAEQEPAAQEDAAR